MKLYYRHFGNGEPVIILHGLFGQSDNWVTVGKRIADHFSVYIPDQRNHGNSPHAPVHTYPALSDDLLEFMHNLHLQKCILIGHSMGGKVAMNFAMEHPEMVEKLVIIDISPKKYPERNIHTQVITQMMSIDLDTFTSRTQVERVLEERIPEVRIRMFILKNLLYIHPGKLGWRLNLQAINDNLDELFDTLHQNSPFNGPSLFIRGGLSDYISENDSPEIMRLFPESIIKTISGASHWVHADAPDELCRLLSEFLGKECRFPS